MGAIVAFYLIVLTHVGPYSEGPFIKPGECIAKGYATALPEAFWICVVGVDKKKYKNVKGGDPVDQNNWEDKK